MARSPELAHPVLRRLVASTQADQLVLRGGLVTAHYIRPHPRIVDDLDLLSPEPFDAARLEQQLQDVLATVDDDGLALTLRDVETIWAETEFPGLRAQVTSGEQQMQVDIGCADPMVDGPVPLQLFADCTVQACRPETMVAWKTHGLFDRGSGQWRPKDLDDIDQLLRHTRPDPVRLRASVRLAFASRGDSLAIAERLVVGSFGGSRWSAHKWQRFRETRPEGADPGEMGPVLDRVRAAIVPLLT